TTDTTEATATLYCSPATRTGLAQIWNETLARQTKKDFVAVLIAGPSQLRVRHRRRDLALHGESVIQEVQKMPKAGWVQIARMAASVSQKDGQDLSHGCSLRETYV